MINGVEVLLIDGAIFEDYRKQTNLNFEQSLKLCLLQGHLAPHGPNSLEIEHGYENSLWINRLPWIVITTSSNDFSYFDIRNQ